MNNITAINTNLLVHEGPVVGHSHDAVLIPGDHHTVRRLHLEVIARRKHAENRRRQKRNGFETQERLRCKE